jgi:26S proteasome non-ATPase regulatory subunit 10
MIRAAEAARAGDVDFFKHMLDSDQLKSLCGRKDEDGRTLLHSASTSGNVELVQLLLHVCGGEGYVDVSDPEGWSPLISAASCGHEAIARLLLDAGARPDTATQQGRTALHYAASKGHLAIAKLLLQAGASPQASDVTGALPLHRAASQGHWPLVRLLLGVTKTPDAKDRSGATPLFLAAQGGHQVAALMLTAHGCDVETEDGEGETPLLAASRHGALRQSMVDIATGEKCLDDFDIES